MAPHPTIAFAIQQFEQVEQACSEAYQRKVHSSWNYDCRLRPKVSQRVLDDLEVVAWRGGTWACVRPKIRRRITNCGTSSIDLMDMFLFNPRPAARSSQPLRDGRPTQGRWVSGRGATKTDASLSQDS